MSQSIGSHSVRKSAHLPKKPYATSPVTPRSQEVTEEKNLGQDSLLRPLGSIRQRETGTGARRRMGGIDESLQGTGR